MMEGCRFGSGRYLTSGSMKTMERAVQSTSPNLPFESICLLNDDLARWVESSVLAIVDNALRAFIGASGCIHVPPQII